MQKFQQNKPLCELSTFGIGGIASLYTEVETIDEMQEVLSHCTKEKIPFHIVGKGSNSLFPDEGLNGLVILNKISFCEIKEHLVFVGAGYNFSLLGVQTARKGLSGLEFASGIPASVGGAIFMNAGANGKETCDTLHEVIFVNEQGEREVYHRPQLEFSYRSSPFQKKRGAIVAAKFLLQPEETARKHQLKILEYRLKTQPYKDKSCGCVFRNPTGQSAGELIDKCGLKGFQIGDAQVSELHANFIVNKGNAKAKDVLALASHIKQCIKETTGVDLEMEIVIVRT